MRECTCPLAGYCDRHAVDKSPHWHHLCKTRTDYRTAWDRGNGPGQTEHLAARLERRAKVIASREKTYRLIGWIKSCRQPGDEGVGDTASRLQSISGKKSEIHALIKRLLAQCDCKQVDAVARLNKEYPYTS